jgi:hypothetical protein
LLYEPIATDEAAFHMLASIVGCSASLAFFQDLELKTALVAIVNFALFHICAVDHSNLLIKILALDYIHIE